MGVPHKSKVPSPFLNLLLLLLPQHVIIMNVFFTYLHFDLVIGRDLISITISHSYFQIVILVTNLYQELILKAFYCLEFMQSAVSFLKLPKKNYTKLVIDY